MKSIKSLITIVVLFIFPIVYSHAFGSCEQSRSTEIRFLKPNFVIGHLSFIPDNNSQEYANFLNIKFEYVPFDQQVYIIREKIIFKKVSIWEYFDQKNHDYTSVEFPDQWNVKPYYTSAHGKVTFSINKEIIPVDVSRFTWGRGGGNYSVELKQNTINNITLTFRDLQNHDIFLTDVTVTFPNTGLVTNRPCGALVHTMPVRNISNNINIVVMAEGYQAEQIHHFNYYVMHAFHNVANFNSSNNPDVNNFFQRHWKDNINVFTYETNSLHAGIGDNISSCFNVHPQYPNRTDRSQMWNIVNATASESGYPELPENVDAYIILVNDKSISSYTLPFNAEVGWRKGQPVNYIIIRAPIGYNANASNFHQFVETNKIGELLGTAMAGLMPEYSIRLTQYSSNLRNISDVEPSVSKWRKLWNVKDFQATNDNDHRLDGNSRNAWYGNTQLYIPSKNCVMHANEGGAVSTQFCPVCEYHLEGSFRTRMSVIPAQDPLFDGSNISTYEWRGFSVEDL